MSATAALPWQRVWREGVAPQLSTAGLQALQKALEQDDPALIQGQNLFPPPLQSYASDQVVAACAICFSAWKGDYQGCAPVAEVDLRFDEVCYQASQLLGEPAAVGQFLTEYDSWSREEMRRNLLPEVRLALAGRLESAAREPSMEALPIKPPKKMSPSIDHQLQVQDKKIS
jgi:hypothetical protein